MFFNATSKSKNYQTKLEAVTNIMRGSIKNDEELKGVKKVIEEILTVDIEKPLSKTLIEQQEMLNKI